MTTQMPEAPTAEEHARLQVLLGMTQNQLANAHANLAQRETDVAILQEQNRSLNNAVETLQNALSEQVQRASAAEAAATSAPPPPNRATRRASAKKKPVSTGGGDA